VTMQHEARKPLILGLVHTVPLLVDVFTTLTNELLPGVRLLHIVDQPLLLRVSGRGCAVAEDVQRLETHIRALADVGATVVLVTCSTLSPYVDRLAVSVPVPVLRIDKGMITHAVAEGCRIGLVATIESALTSMRAMLIDEAERVGKTIMVEPLLVDGGLAALMAGDSARHDLLVKQAILRVGDQVDVIVLAQASMDRVLATLPNGYPKAKVLSSPRLALAEAGRLLGK